MYEGAQTKQRETKCKTNFSHVSGERYMQYKQCPYELNIIQINES
jgi:hypothetical protein